VLCDQSAAEKFRSSRPQTIVLLVFGSLLAIGLGLYIARGIVRSLLRVKDVCDSLAQNITGVAEAARLTMDGVRQSQQATDELARMSAELTSLVSAFRY
jgi:methyl-accepting chemotaxis protein